MLVIILYPVTET